MKRREFLIGSAGVAAWGVSSGCNSAPQPQAQSTAEPKAASPMANGAQGLQVLFHGLNLFALQDPSKKFVDAAFVNSRVDPALPVNVHVATLKVRRDLPDQHSNVAPNAVDESSAYYTLRGPVEILPRSSPNPGDWNTAPAPDLEWIDENLSDPNPTTAPGADAWNNMRWILSFTDLYANARLPAGWRDGADIVGWLRLSNGLLEKGFGPDDTTKYQYTIKGQRRLLKDQVRYFLPAGEGAYTQIKFGGQGSLVLKTDGSVDVFHLPTPGMDAGQGPLTDYYALYQLLLTPDQLKEIGDYAKREVPSNRTEKFTGKKTPLSGGCSSVLVRE